MLLVAPAATAFATPGSGAPDSCKGAGTPGCHTSRTATSTAGTTPDTDPDTMSHHPCAKPADSPSTKPSTT
jgi:hypothetical protein